MYPLPNNESNVKGLLKKVNKIINDNEIRTR
jgi:hypothetical protein